MVSYLKIQYCLSERRSCRLIKLSRTAARYQHNLNRDVGLKKRLKTLAEQYPRYGYLMLHEMPKVEGLVINRKRTYRLYTELGLQVKTKRRKKLVRPRMPLSVPERPNQRWSLDFVSDQLANGRRFRVLNIVDDYSRECVGQLADTSISRLRMARFLDQISLTRPLPGSIVCDNGPEMTSKAMFFWSKERNIKLGFIQPGKPTQNAFVESFNARFRDNCLNQHWFTDLNETRHLIEQWRVHYNEVRPHSSLDYLPPSKFAAKAA